jgi:uncharacterized membrane protein
MNIGLGLILIPIFIIFILLGVFSLNQKDKLIGSGLFVVGVIILSASILLISGIYDPYSSHIR